MKKFLAGLMAFSFLALNALPVFAAVNLADVGQNYWARKEIVDVVENNIMTVNSSNCFAPEKSMTRVEFVNALLKILTNDNLDVKIQNQFKDVASSNPNYDNILRSQQLGLVYGYPDKTFQPNRVMLRSEAQRSCRYFCISSIQRCCISSCLGKRCLCKNSCIWHLCKLS